MEYPKSIETPKGWMIATSKAHEDEILKRFKVKKQKANDAKDDDVMTLDLDTESLNHGDK